MGKRNISIRFLLVIGISLIFIAAMGLLTIIAVGTVKNLGKSLTEISEDSICRGASYLFLERARKTASSYATELKNVSSLTDILATQLTAAFKNYDYCLFNDKQKWARVSGLSINPQDGIINYPDKDIKIFCGSTAMLSDNIKKKLYYVSDYFRFMKDVCDKNPLYLSSWIFLSDDKVLIEYINKVSVTQGSQTQSGFTNPLSFRIYGGSFPQWSKIINDNDIQILCRSYDLYDAKGRVIGKCGIKIDADGLLTGISNYDFSGTTKKPLLKNGNAILNSESKKNGYSTFIIDGADASLIVFPIKYYERFGLLKQNIGSAEQNDILKISDSRDKQIVELAKKLLKEESGFNVLTFSDGEKFIVTYAKLSENGWIVGTIVPLNNLLTVAQVTEIEMYSLIKRLTIVLFCLCMMFYLIAVGLILFAFKRFLLKPIAGMITEIKKVGKGDFNAKLSETGVYEISSLAQTFNKMTENLTKYMAKLEEEVTERSEMEVEIEMAKNIQKSLLPFLTKLFKREEFELYADLLETKSITGNFYDYFFITRDRIVALVADISGKGVPAAYYMTILKSLIREACTVKHADPGGALEEVNDTLFKDHKVGMVVSLALLYYDIPSGNIQYAGAGDVGIAMVNKDGGGQILADLNSSNMLAVNESTKYKTKKAMLGTSDIVLLYTAGVLEGFSSQNADRKKKLTEFLSKNHVLPLEELFPRLFSEIKGAEKDKKIDNATIVAVKKLD